MDKEYAVVAKGVTKIYRMFPNQGQKLMHALFGHGKYEEMYALKGVTFNAEKGDSIGLLGLNGSGKSTLSDILAGVSMPTKGHIVINGEPSVVAVSGGLDAQLTGIENIERKGLLIGLTNEQIGSFTENIIQFANIGRYIYQPVKTYSSGMRARLGFAISITINPDILVIDEALAVGDPSFTNQCLDAMNKFREQGKTIFFVSHNLSQVESFCNKAIWLEYGVLKAYGDADDILPMYRRFISTYSKMTLVEKDEYAKEVIENHNHFLLGSNVK